MAAMNPYAFRGWHIPSYADSANCDRNYPHMYGTWPHSGYFTPGSMYSLPSDSTKQHANTDWKLNSICTSTTSEGTSPRDNNLRGVQPVHRFGARRAKKGPVIH